MNVYSETIHFFFVCFFSLCFCLQPLSCDAPIGDSCGGGGGGGGGGGRILVLTGCCSRASPPLPKIFFLLMFSESAQDGYRRTKIRKSETEKKSGGETDLLCKPLPYIVGGTVRVGK